jgi:hypothetical protein
MKRKGFVVLTVAIVAVAGTWLLAHHSAANYDTSKSITLQGTVTEFKLANPHPSLYFKVKGDEEEWFGESAAPPARWYNSGWRGNALKAGDEITITGAPTKDGRKMVRIRKIVTSAGKEWTEGAQGQ